MQKKARQASKLSSDLAVIARASFLLTSFQYSLRSIGTVMVMIGSESTKTSTRLDVGLLRGLILAAGEGRRLHSYVRQMKNLALPKQYVNLVGRGSLLEDTFERAEKLIRAERIYTVVSRAHLEHAEVRRQLAAPCKQYHHHSAGQQGNRPGSLAPAYVRLQAMR